LQRLLQRRPDLSEARARLVQLFVNAGEDEAAMRVDDAID
jgi:hypothetical protein